MFTKITTTTTPQQHVAMYFHSETSGEYFKGEFMPFAESEQPIPVVYPEITEYTEGIITLDEYLQKLSITHFLDPLTIPVENPDVVKQGQYSI